MIKLLIERLPGNNLGLPKYATEESAGIDLCACLTRLTPLHADSQNKYFQIMYEKGVPISVNIGPNSSILVPFGIKCQIKQDDGVVKAIAPKRSRGPYESIGTYNPQQDTILFNHTPKTYVIKLYVRSSLGKKGLALANGTGIIDSDYRGEIFACLYNRTDDNITINHGERIVQAIVEEYERCTIVEGKVNDTPRGEGGFGSTGT